MQWHIWDSLAESPASPGPPAHWCGAFPANRNALLCHKAASHLVTSALLWGQCEPWLCTMTHRQDQVDPPSPALPREVSGMGSASPGASDGLSAVCAGTSWPCCSLHLPTGQPGDPGWGVVVMQTSLCCPGITPRHSGCCLPALIPALLPL